MTTTCMEAVFAGVVVEGLPNSGAFPVGAELGLVEMPVEMRCTALVSRRRYNRCREEILLKA